MEYVDLEKVDFEAMERMGLTGDDDDDDDGEEGGDDDVDPEKFSEREMKELDDLMKELEKDMVLRYDDDDEEDEFDDDDDDEDDENEEEEEEEVYDGDESEEDLRKLEAEMKELERLVLSTADEAFYDNGDGGGGGRETGSGGRGHRDDFPDDEEYFTAATGDDGSSSRAAAASATSWPQQNANPADAWDAAAPPTPDWLETRRSRLGASPPPSSSPSSSVRPVDMATPRAAAASRSLDATLPVKPSTLLSSTEIATVLTDLGGRDVSYLPDAGRNLMGGAKGIVVATGRDMPHLREMSDAIVRNMRARGLDRLGVVGAAMGPEGGKTDSASSKRNRNRRWRKFGSSGYGAAHGADDGWMVVDCRNYVVHVQDEVTRRCVDLEGLWSTEPGSKGEVLRAVDGNDEGQVDEYVANNPVPDEYARKIAGTTGEQHGMDGYAPRFDGRGKGGARGAERWSSSQRTSERPIRGKKKGRGRNRG